MASNHPVGRQRDAVESEASCLLVVAPPGCGKTELLAMRAAHLLRSGAVRPGRRLLAVTFTNRARDNLRDRLVQQVGQDRLRSSVTVTNIHQLGAQILEAHHKVIGIEPGYSVPSPAWQRKALQAISADWKSHGPAKELLDRLCREPLTDEELMEKVMASGDRVARELECRRRTENIVRFGDLLRYTQLILRNPRVSSLFRSHFDAVLVDEFQDLSLQQYEIVRQVCTGRATYVGDPYQGIFDWAGAQPDLVHADLRERAGQVVELDVSFRSSPAVLEVVNAASASLGAAPLRAHDPDVWTAGGHAYAEVYPTDVDEAAGIVALTDHLATEFPGDTVGVICRSGFRRGKVDAAYKDASHLPQFWDIALDTPRVVRLLKRHVRTIGAGGEFVQQVENLREITSASLDSADVDTLGEVNSACDQLLEYDANDVDLKALIARIRDTQSTASISPGVHVLNAHVAKGQQFDWVVVMGLEEDHVPDYRADSPALLLEEQRVLLVMLSRARKALFLTAAGQTTNKYGRVFRPKRSRWWMALAQASKPMTDPIRLRMHAQ